MKIKNEDLIFGSLILILLSIWYLTLKFYNFPIISIIILWIGMTLLSLIYVYIYKKRNRDKKILRIRFYITAIPIYPMLAYYIYKLIIEFSKVLLSLFILCQTIL